MEQGELDVNAIAVGLGLTGKRRSHTAGSRSNSRTVALNQDDEDYIRALGKGSLTDGVRALVKAHKVNSLADEPLV